MFRNDKIEINDTIYIPQNNLSFEKNNMSTHHIINNDDINSVNKNIVNNDNNCDVSMTLNKKKTSYLLCLSCNHNYSF